MSLSQKLMYRAIFGQLSIWRVFMIIMVTLVGFQAEGVLPRSNTRVSDEMGAARTSKECNGRRLHAGLDLTGNSSLSSEELDVYAIADGNLVVINSTIEATKGIWVSIKHMDQKESSYLHLQSIDIGILALSSGRKVLAGTLIGVTGSTGTEKPHLHFEILDIATGEYIHPWDYLGLPPEQDTVAPTIWQAAIIPDSADRNDVVALVSDDPANRVEQLPAGTWHKGFQVHYNKKGTPTPDYPVVFEGKGRVRFILSARDHLGTTGNWSSPHLLEWKLNGTTQYRVEMGIEEACGEDFWAGGALGSAHGQGEQKSDASESSIHGATPPALWRTVNVLGMSVGTSTGYQDLNKDANCGRLDAFATLG